MALAAVLLLLASLPAWAPNRFWINVASQALIFATFAVSLDLLVGYAGMPSLGHATFYAAGAYVAALWSLHERPDLLPMLGLAVLAGAGVALPLGALALRASGIYFLMLTLALGQMAWALVSNNDLRDVLGGDIGLIGVGRPELLAGVRLAEPSSFYYLVLALATLSFAFLTVVVSSPFGRTLEGIRENEHRMRALGYPVFRYRLAAFVIAGGVAGLAGMLAATFSNAANPALAYWTTSGLALIAAIIGGVRSLLGPAIGAAIVVIMQVSVAVQVGAVSATLLPIGLVFVAFVLFAPGGLVRLARFRG